MQNKYNLVFSIAVHERPETIIDQIINVFSFNQGSAIILHLSKQFNFSSSILTESAFYHIISSFPDVYLNPTRLSTNQFSLLKTHLSNFSFFTKTVGANFSYFVLLNSNDLFVKKGFFESMHDEECGIEPRLLSRRWFFSSEAESDQMFLSVQKENNLQKPVVSFLEGSYYSQSLFRSIFNSLDMSRIESSCFSYPAEELMIPSLASHFSKKTVFRRAVLNGGGDLFVSLSTIRRAKKNQYKFAVKRINRNFDDPYRVYIRQKICKSESRLSALLLYTSPRLRLSFFFCDPFKRLYHDFLFDLKVAVGKLFFKNRRNNKH